MAHLFWPLELVNARIIQISDRQQVATAQGDYPGARLAKSLFGEKELDINLAVHKIKAIKVLL